MQNAVTIDMFFQPKPQVRPSDVRARVVAEGATTEVVVADQSFENLVAVPIEAVETTVHVPVKQVAFNVQFLDGKTDLSPEVTGGGDVHTTSPDLKPVEDGQADIATPTFDGFDGRALLGPKGIQSLSHTSDAPIDEMQGLPRRNSPEFPVERELPLTNSTAEQPHGTLSEVASRDMRPPQNIPSVPPQKPEPAAEMIDTRNLVSPQDAQTANNTNPPAPNTQPSSRFTAEVATLPEPQEGAESQLFEMLDKPSAITPRAVDETAKVALTNVKPTDITSFKLDQNFGTGENSEMLAARQTLPATRSTVWSEKLDGSPDLGKQASVTPSEFRPLVQKATGVEVDKKSGQHQPDAQVTAIVRSGANMGRLISAPAVEPPSSPQLTRREPEIAADAKQIAPTRARNQDAGHSVAENWLRQASRSDPQVAAQFQPTSAIHASGLVLDSQMSEPLPFSGGQDLTIMSRGVEIPPPISALPPGDPARFAHVSRQLMEVAARHGDGPIELTLSPEELGRVRMNFAVQDGTLTVTVATERSETLALMRRHIDALLQDFQDIGYSEVNLEFTGSDSQQTGEDLPQEVANESSPSSDGTISSVEGAREPIRINLEAAGSSGLDLRI